VAGQRAPDELCFADLTVSQIGADAQISLFSGGTDAIILADIDSSVIDETDFVFA
jgi:hypothetical protein